MVSSDYLVILHLVVVRFNDVVELIISGGLLVVVEVKEQLEFLPCFTSPFFGVLSSLVLGNVGCDFENSSVLVCIGLDGGLIFSIPFMAFSGSLGSSCIVSGFVGSLSVVDVGHVGKVGLLKSS